LGRRRAFHEGDLVVRRVALQGSRLLRFESFIFSLCCGRGRKMPVRVKGAGHTARGSPAALKKKKARPPSASPLKAGRGPLAHVPRQCRQRPLASPPSGRLRQGERGSVRVQLRS
jgi:hypothetical protein